jgi:hypothetical protein
VGSSRTLPRKPAASSFLEGAPQAPLSFFGLRPGTVSENQICVVGHDGHMFLLRGSNNLYDMYQRSNNENDWKLVNEWASLFSRRADRLANAGCKYLQIIIPEKSSVLHDKFPVPIPAPTPLLAKLELRINDIPQLRPSYASMFDHLISHPSRLDCFRLIDSHMTPRGSWITFQGILKGLNLPSDRTFDFDATVPYPGDLAGAFSEPLFQEYLNFMQPNALAEYESKLVQIEDFEPHDGAHIGRRIIWQNSSSASTLRVVAFGNSFFERGTISATLSWWAARWFREFHFLWQPEVQFDYIERIKPDVVICQTIERFLPLVPEH